MSANLSLLKCEAITTDNERNINISIVKHEFLSEQHRLYWNNLYKINIGQSGQQKSQDFPCINYIWSLMSIDKYSFTSCQNLKAEMMEPSQD